MSRSYACIAHLLTDNDEYAIFSQTKEGCCIDHENTNWGQSVTAVVIHDGKVLLARHTYGAGSGKLIIPGGYVNFGESPEEAVKREYMEETHIAIAPKDIIGIRFHVKCWYIAFRADYVSGEAKSDENENSEVIWMDVQEALSRDDVPGLTKHLIQSAISGKDGLSYNPSYTTKESLAPYSLYCL